MTNEELVAEYQIGNKAALEELIINNKGIVRKIANKFYIEKTASIDFDDLIQEGTIGLMIAAKKYNCTLENKSSFIVYAVYWIYQKINRFIRCKNTNEETSLNKPTTEEQELGEMIADSKDYICEVNERIYIQELHNEMDQVMIECLTLQQREIICFYFGWDRQKGGTKEEIAEILGLTYSSVNTKYNIALKKMRESKWGRVKQLERHNERLAKGSYDTLDNLKAWEIRLFTREELKDQFKYGGIKE